MSQERQEGHVKRQCRCNMPVVNRPIPKNRQAAQGQEINVPRETEDTMQRLDLTHTGKFSQRAGSLLRAILQNKGQAELGSGLGLIPGRNDIGIMVSFNGDLATIFLPREAKALIEIITDTDAQEEPYSPQSAKILNQLVSDLQSLVAEAEEFHKQQIDQSLDATKH